MAKGSRAASELIGPMFPSAVSQPPVGAIWDLRGCLERGDRLRTEPGLLPGPIQDPRLITAGRRGHRPRGGLPLAGEARFNAVCHNPESFSGVDTVQGEHGL